MPVYARARVRAIPNSKAMLPLFDILGKSYPV